MLDFRRNHSPLVSVHRSRFVAPSAASLLKQLEHHKDLFGDGAAARKAELLRKLDRRSLRRAAEVHRLHEVLCFLRAYPDDAPTLELVERMLERFSRRGDLRRHRRELADSGVAGTAIHFNFFWLTAEWLSRRWPDRLFVDWKDFDRQDRVDGLLHLLVPYAETPLLDMLVFSAPDWIETLKGPAETDATFLIRRFAAMRVEPFVREKIYEDLEVPLRIEPSADTPSRTRAKLPPRRVVFQSTAPTRKRPALRREIDRPPVATRALGPRDGQKVIDLAREAMITRSRDLWAFQHADRNDVRMVDCGGGLQFACIGCVPERRLVLEGLYGFLTLRNGVPIGYVLSSSLFGSTEVAYNVFDTFRKAEAGHVFGRVMAMMRHLFGSDAFSIDPYQLGFGNPEGLQSGAWWFYYKLGFRPRDADVRRVLRGELRRMKADPGHRSSTETLEKLAADYLYFYLDGPRTDTLGSLSLGEIGHRISRYLADRFGADREAGIRTSVREAARLLGVPAPSRGTPGMRLAWQRWAPLILSLPGVSRWSPARRRELAGIVRAKGGRRESEYIKRFDRHSLLRKALLKLAREGTV